MLNRLVIFLFLIQTLFGYSIFDHVRDFNISSSTYTASHNNNQNFYNFSNPACNSTTGEYMYSSFGNRFNGILNTQQLFFTLDTKFLDKINFAILRTSIDDIHNTTEAWLDDGDGIIDISEIDYGQIYTFNHNNYGFIISKPFKINNFDFGINSKLSMSSLLDEYSLYHAFDLGIYKKKNNFNLGLVIKDLLPYSYWSTGLIENGKTSLLLGLNFDLKSLDISMDINPINKEHFLGFEYNYNSLVSVQLSNSTFDIFYLGFLVKFEKLNIGYSFSIPMNNELGTNQKVVLGINKNILTNYK